MLPFINGMSDWGVTPLHCQKDVEDIKDIIKAGGDVNTRDCLDRTPLHIQKDEKILRFLINEGADVHAKDWIKMTPLHRQKDEGSVKALIQAGANVNAKDEYGNTPLHYTKDEGSVKSLIHAGANFNTRNIYGKNPLHYQKDERSIRVLIEAGADVKNIYRQNPLIQKVYENICSERITRFIRNCKWFKLYNIVHDKKSDRFYRWYCGEEDGNGGGTGRKVDHQRIMNGKWNK